MMKILKQALTNQQLKCGSQCLLYWSGVCCREGFFSRVNMELQHQLRLEEECDMAVIRPNCPALITFSLQAKYLRFGLETYRQTYLLAGSARVVLVCTQVRILSYYNHRQTEWTRNLSKF